MNLDELVARSVCAYVVARDGRVPDNELVEVEVVARITAERYEAYRDGWRDGVAAVRGASNAIAAAADWRRIADGLTAAQTAAAHRARLCDARPRADDFPGRQRGGAV